MGMALADLGAFKTMFDLAKGLKDLNDATTRNAVAIELEEKILTAQAEQSALIQQISELEAKVAQLETWDADKKRYELTEFAPGQFAYVLKPEAAAGEPTHMLCQRCYNQNQKAILQTEVRFPGRHKVTFCQNCGTDLFSPETGGRTEGHPTVKSGPGSWVNSRRGR